MYKEYKKNFERYCLFSLWIDFCQKIERYFYISFKIMKNVFLNLQNYVGLCIFHHSFSFLRRLLLVLNYIAFRVIVLICPPWRTELCGQFMKLKQKYEELFSRQITNRRITKILHISHNLA